MDSTQLEKYTSAITLSDMEIFVFPELMYSLVLANIMSPIIWKWRQEDCFKKLEGKNSYKKLMRLRQFIMDEYEFNLDLETWGLTRQSKELRRFENFISPDDIAKSNALFGYEGDKYYFDVDIRKHFGLDKYDGDIIPYWKTETVEAMEAFRLKKGYRKAAGECVSLAAIYAAAAFIVCRIPLEDIYMILTPLHSQNFIDINDGILTNNRRLITKTMWFNGTAISAKAQRALRNEQVTAVTHNTGYIHCLYKNATIDFNANRKFRQKLAGYLSTPVSTLVMANFLRCRREYQKYFQFCCEHRRDADKFIKAELLFHYEHDSTFRIADETFEKLLAEVSDEDIMPYKLSDRMCCQQLVTFIEYEKADITKEAGRAAIKQHIRPFMPQPEKFVDDLADFVHIEPDIQGIGKNFVDNEPINLSCEQSREQIIEYLHQTRTRNITAELAFYAYRDMVTCDWNPFIKAAIERNPVSIEMTDSMSVEEVYRWLDKMNNVSIYDGKRLATPDEVANYMTADGLEKAFFLANILYHRNRKPDIEITAENNNVILKEKNRYSFTSTKGFNKMLRLTDLANCP